MKVRKNRLDKDVGGSGCGRYVLEEYHVFLAALLEMMGLYIYIFASFRISVVCYSFYGGSVVYTEGGGCLVVLEKAKILTPKVA